MPRVTWRTQRIACDMGIGCPKRGETSCSTAYVIHSNRKSLAVKYSKMRDDGAQDMAQILPQGTETALEPACARSLVEDVTSIIRNSIMCVVVVMFVSAVFPSSSHMPRGYLFVSDVLGYLYTAAWSYSFYPQFILNHKRKCDFMLFVALHCAGVVLSNV